MEDVTSDKKCFVKSEMWRRHDRWTSHCRGAKPRLVLSTSNVASRKGTLGP